MSQSASALEVGAIVSDTYEVTRLIGRGSMGEVWLASHRRLPGKQVAIKVLFTRAQPLPAAALARFRREAEVVARIGHPNIVEVHDFNTLPSGAPYLVLEFLSGETLASRLRYGPMSLEEVSAVVSQVGSALDASHQLSVVHRDLKPDNIFLVTGPMGTQAKVLDFGISKVIDSTTLQTQEAVLVGTPQYMSPEQAVGHNKEVGPQTDIFALGSITYEMLAGQPPFAADSVAQLVFRIAYEPHRPLAEAKADLPARMVLAVETALLKDRAVRYQTVAQFVADFTGRAISRAPTRGDPSSAHSSGMAQPDGPALQSLEIANTMASSPPAVVTPHPSAPPVPTPVAWAAPPVGVAAPSSDGETRPMLAASPAHSGARFVVGLAVIGVAAAALAFVALRPAPQTVTPPAELHLPAPPVPVAAPPVPPVALPAAPAAVVDAGPASADPEGAGAQAAPRLSAQQRAVLDELRAQLRHDAGGALHRVQKELRSAGGEAMETQLLVLGAKAACNLQDQQQAMSYARQLKHARPREEVRRHCGRVLTTPLQLP